MVREQEHYEIVVSDGEEALTVVIPDKIVNKIKKLGDCEKFKKNSNEVILSILSKSLEEFLNAHEHSTTGSIKNNDDVKMTRD